MKERPILFSGSMVRAILEGRKTQTRRVMNPQPFLEKYKEGESWWLLDRGEHQTNSAWKEYDPPFWAYSPWGVPGDLLWVRETFMPDGVNAKAAAELGRQPVHYRADGEAPDYLKVRWRPAIYMPRWASRITLEVERVRVERVQEISEEDAIAEGVEPIGGDPNYGTNRYSVRVPGGWLNFPTAKLAFQSLWDSINEKRGFSWAANPWVWAVKFGQVSCGT